MFHIHIYIRRYIPIDSSLYIYIYAYLYIYVYTYIYIYKHAYIHTERGRERAYFSTTLRGTMMQTTIEEGAVGNW